MSDFEADVRRIDGAVVIAVHGEVDLATAPALRAAVDDGVAAGTDLVLDLADVSFIDSSGLAVLIGAAERLAPDRAMVVRSSQRQARRLFETTGVDKLLHIES